MPHIKLGDEVILRTHPGIRWTVSYVEGNKIYCYNLEPTHRSSIVVDVSLLAHDHEGDEEEDNP